MTSTGWPFLVAAGRRRDYSTLLAPDFLIADLDYGILDEVVRPTSEAGPATVVEVRTRGGRRLTIVYATHLLTTADLPARASGVRDEHGRPLRLIYGFAALDTWIPAPAQDDLDAARDAALAVYRRFLGDEERFAVVPSRPFPLRSAVRAMLAAPEPVSSHPPRRALWLGGAALAAGLAVAAAVSGFGQHAPAIAPVSCPTAGPSLIAVPSAGVAPPASAAPSASTAPSRRATPSAGAAPSAGAVPSAGAGASPRSAAPSANPSCSPRAPRQR